MNDNSLAISILLDKVEDYRRRADRYAAQAYGSKTAELFTRMADQIESSLEELA